MLLPERFSLVRKLGQGGMGVVYEVIDHERNARVALKTLLNLKPVALYRFKNEFRTLAGLSHANLIPLYELISDGHTWFFTMELVEGVDFLAAVRPRLDPSDPMPDSDDVTMTSDIVTATFEEHRLRNAVRQLALGVTALHDASILHRDIKPSNVLVREDGRLQLLDFGLAKELSTSTSSDDHTIEVPVGALRSVTVSDDHVVGSVGYMSPEQAAGSALTDASDWYAFGAVVYEALTGVRPFVGTPREVMRLKQTAIPIDPRRYTASAPADLSDLAMALLQRDSRKRPTGREVLAVVAAARPAAAKRSGAAAAAMPFVGREPHMAALHAALATLQQSRAVVVQVHGPSGAGKTTLTQQFLASVSRQTDVVILAGRCYEQESVPFKALDSLVDALCQYLLTLPTMEAGLLMPRDIKALARLFPVLERVEAVRLASHGQRDLPDVQEVRRRGVRGLGELLQRLGDRRLLVLSIDDLQWGDEDSATLLAALLQSPDPPRLLLLAAHRSEYAQTSACLQALTRAKAAQTDSLAWLDVEVAPLSFEDSSVLARQLMGTSAAGDPERVARVARESHGNPYFVYELVRHSQLRTGLELDDVLWRRVCELPSEVAHLVQVVAVAGQPLRQKDAFAAAGLTESQQAVARLRAEHLVRTTGPGLADEIETFHDRIRESIVAHLTPERTREFHHRIALSLEAEGAIDLERMAAHFRQAGEHDRAGMHYLTAADKAAEALAFPRSAHLYSLALQLRPLTGAQARIVRRKLGDALANAGRGFEAAQAYEQACAGAAIHERLELERLAGYHYCVSGHIDEGRRAFSAVLAHFGQKLPPTRRRALASLLVRRLRLLVRGLTFVEREAGSVPPAVLERVDMAWSVATGITIFDPIRGADFQTQGLLLALRAGEPYRVARALAWEAAHIGMVGVALKARAEGQLEAADALARRIGHPHAMGMVKMSRGVAAYFHGDFRLCQQHSDEAVDLFRNQCTGVAWELETSNAFAYWSLYYRGEYLELTRRYRALVSEVRERGARMAEADLVTFGGPFVWLTADDPAGAAHAVASVMGEWSQQDFQVQHFTTLTANAQIAMYAGRYEDAWALISEQWAGVKSAMLLHVELVHIYMLWLRARAAIAALDSTLDPSPLLRSAARDAARLERMRPRHAKALAKLAKAALIRRSGDTASAMTLLRDGAGQLNQLGWECFGIPAERCLGQMMGDDAGRHLAAAAEATLRAQGVKNIDRLVNLQVPGFARQ